MVIEIIMFKVTFPPFMVGVPKPQQLTSDPPCYSLPMFPLSRCTYTLQLFPYPPSPWRLSGSRNVITQSDGVYRRKSALIYSNS